MAQRARGIAQAVTDDRDDQKAEPDDLVSYLTEEPPCTAHRTTVNPVRWPQRRTAASSDHNEVRRKGHV